MIDQEEERRKGQAQAKELRDSLWRDPAKKEGFGHKIFARGQRYRDNYEKVRWDRD